MEATHYVSCSSFDLKLPRRPGKVLTMGKEAIPQGETINSEVELRDRLIDLVSVGNLKHKPKALFTLFRQFLTRISLPRLIHFMDLVLPQLTPVQAAWAGEEKTLWSCHHIRWLRERQSDATPRVQISYFFSSHDSVHHVRIQWNSNPLLLFSDPIMVEALPVEHFQQASHMTHQQHLQMELRKGMAILIYYVVENTHYQAVLLAEESVIPLSMEHSFYMPVSAIRGLFSQLLTVPLYRQPNTLGWPYLDAPIDPGDQWSSDTFLPLRNLLMLLPNFMPSAVQELQQTFQINGTHFYNLSALTHLREKGILPGTRSDDMSSLYDWPLEWEPRASLDSPFFSSLQSSDAENWQLLRKLGGHSLRRLIAALLAPNGHFPSLLLSTLWGIQGGFTSLCVQGIFGSGKTYCASLLLVLVSTVLQLPTVLTAEPNLPLATAAETISDLLRDAPAESRAAYARVLAYGVPKLTPIDVLPIDRPKLFQADSPLMCLILTHGSVLRDLCCDYPQLRSFLEACRLAINDESQQGGHAGFTILATCLARACLQIFTGDREQTRAGTGGDLLRESLLQRLAHKGIGFLDGPPPKLPLEMLASFASALADECSFPLIGTSGPDPFPLLAALTTQVLPPSCHPKTVRAAEGHVPTVGVLLHLILPHSLRCPADAYLTQVAMHYPHFHRPDGAGVAYGHYEEPPRQLRDSRLPIDMQGRTHPISGYRLVHWSPDLKPGLANNHMEQSSRDSVLTAVLSFFTARSVRLDNESSKLLLLTPHNDRVLPAAQEHLSRF